MPRELNDRAADIWEPLLVIADLAGGPLAGPGAGSGGGHGPGCDGVHPIALLLFDIVIEFADAQSDRMFSSELVQHLTCFPGRPWRTLQKGKPIDERWLARQLHPYGIRSRNLRIGAQQAKGYDREELTDLCLRYVTQAELGAMLTNCAPLAEPERHQRPRAAERQRPVHYRVWVAAK